MWTFRIIKGRYGYCSFGYLDGEGQGFFWRGASADKLKADILQKVPEAKFID